MGLKKPRFFKDFSNKKPKNLKSPNFRFLKFFKNLKNLDFRLIDTAETCCFSV